MVKNLRIALTPKFPWNKNGHRLKWLLWGHADRVFAATSLRRTHGLTNLIRRSRPVHCWISTHMLYDSLHLTMRLRAVSCIARGTTGRFVGLVNLFSEVCLLSKLGFVVQTTWRIYISMVPNTSRLFGCKSSRLRRINYSHVFPARHELLGNGVMLRVEHLKLPYSNTEIDKLS